MSTAIKLLIATLLFLGTYGSVQAQSNTKHRKGVYLGGQKGWNIFKSRQKYSHIKNRKSRKKLSNKNNQYRKHNAQQRKKLSNFNKKNSSHKRNGKVKLKNTKLGKSGSLYSYSKKKQKPKGRKGKFSNSKKNLNSKMTIHISSGAIMIQGNEETMSDIDVYSNYRPSAHLTAGLMYNHTSKLSLGADVRAFSLKSRSEMNLNLNTFVVGGYAKYNFIPSSNNISPYVAIGPTFSFTQLKQKESLEEGDFENSGDSEDIIISDVTVTNPSFRTPTVPLYGLKLAMGTDFKFSNKLSGFVQVDFDFSSAKNRLKLENFFDASQYENYLNENDFVFYGLSFGIRYNLFQKTSLY